MSLTTSMNHALNGMLTNQDALAIVARNVANAGTPGYHKQSLNVDSDSTSFLSSSVARSFTTALQKYYNTHVSDTAHAQVRSGALDQLQTFLGKVGSANSLDTLYGTLENGLQNLATSPDDYAARSQVITAAQTIATRLNQLTDNVQSMRQDAEGQIATSVKTVNDSLVELDGVNDRLASMPDESAARAALLDQRDRLVATVSEQIDVSARYDKHGAVSLLTTGGLSLLDGTPAHINFIPAGAITAASGAPGSASSVGSLTVTTQSGIELDMIQQKSMQSGRLAALVELRDKTLVDAQSQLDQIAAGLAKAFNTNTTAGTGITNGQEVDLAEMQSGDDFVLNYSENGVNKTVRVVRVDDTSVLPMDYTDVNGTRVVGIDFSVDVATGAATLDALLGGAPAISATGSVLSVVDDGGVTTSVKSLTAHTTSTGTQNAGLALNLFVDNADSAFTGSYDGKLQQLGFAGRIAVNSAIVVNSKLLVQSDPTASLGDASRASYMLDQLNSRTFVGQPTLASSGGNFKLNGNVSSLIGQTMNYQGDVVASAMNTTDEREMALEALNQRVKDDYGVNVDDEMSRLMELQNAYAANARVMSVIKELLDTLIQM